MLGLSGQSVLSARKPLGVIKFCGEARMGKLRVKVKELRRRKGWAQEDLAREMHVSLSTVQRWESKEVKPSRLARRELARLLKKAGISAE